MTGLLTHLHEKGRVLQIKKISRDRLPVVNLCSTCFLFPWGTFVKIMNLFFIIIQYLYCHSIDFNYEPETVGPALRGARQANQQPTECAPIPESSSRRTGKVTQDPGTDGDGEKETTRRRATAARRRTCKERVSGYNNWLKYLWPIVIAL